VAGMLEGKVAMITGGCAGMGLAGVERFVEEGAKVVVADIRDKDGAALEDRFAGKVRFAHCDVRNDEDFAGAVAAAEEAFGGLDVMYHNAGAPATYAKYEDMDVQEWDDAFALLVRGTMLAIKHSVRPMRRRGGGSIILTSSVAYTNLRPNTSSAYVAAKAAVTSLGEIAALDLSADMIRVNTILPGGIPTAIHALKFDKRVEVADRMAPHFEDIFSRYQPLPRMGRVKHIADAALFFASDMSAFITGTHIPIDGGLTLERRMTQKEYLAKMAEAHQHALDELGLQPAEQV
jgi:NAD(P)-dependent dehydrogenase (short-subunit alcohol dehydrogenase family)